MNKQRRNKISIIYDKLTELLEELEEIKDEEEEYKDNIPENLQNSIRYETAEEACDNLDSAISSLEETAEYIEIIIDL